MLLSRLLDYYTSKKHFTADVDFFFPFCVSLFRFTSWHSYFPVLSSVTVPATQTMAPFLQEQSGTSALAKATFCFVRFAMCRLDVGSNFL
jgi:hypothetical protein